LMSNHGMPWSSPIPSARLVSPAPIFRNSKQHTTHTTHTTHARLDVPESTADDEARDEEAGGERGAEAPAGEERVDCGDDQQRTHVPVDDLGRHRPQGVDLVLEEQGPELAVLALFAEDAGVADVQFVELLHGLIGNGPGARKRRRRRQGNAGELVFWWKRTSRGGGRRALWRTGSCCRGRAPRRSRSRSPDRRYSPGQLVGGSE